jgi:hypothetical protein
MSTGPPDNAAKARPDVRSVSWSPRRALRHAGRNRLQRLDRGGSRRRQRDPHFFDDTSPSRSERRRKKQVPSARFERTAPGLGTRHRAGSLRRCASISRGSDSPPPRLVAASRKAPVAERGRNGATARVAPCPVRHLRNPLLAHDHRIAYATGPRTPLSPTGFRSAAPFLPRSRNGA